jgi:hypothetical protein
MFEGLTWPTVGYGTGWTLAVALVILILTLFVRGKVVTEKQHNRELALKQQQVDRAEHAETEWRAEGRIKDTQIQMLREIIAEKDVQLGHMGEVGRTAVATLDAVKALATQQRAQETG